MRELQILIKRHEIVPQPTALDDSCKMLSPVEFNEGKLDKLD